MEQKNYWEIPGFENVYLEDSYVLDFKPLKESIEILVETVLTEEHPLYHEPLPGEQYCYRHMIITFPHAQNYNLVLRKREPIQDLDGSVDYGNIDEFVFQDGQYYLNGEWGELTVTSEPPRLTRDYLSVKNGNGYLLIDKDKIVHYELKPNEGVINLNYTNDSGELLAVQIDRDKDLEGFREAQSFMRTLKGGFSTLLTQGELPSAEKIQQRYPDLMTTEENQAFLVSPSASSV